VRRQGRRPPPFIPGSFGSKGRCSMPSKVGTRPPQHAWGPGGIADRLASAHAAQPAATARTPIRADRTSRAIPEAEKATAIPRSHSTSPVASSVASTDVNPDDREGIATLGGALLRLGGEERATFQALAKQVADEATDGGPRTRFSILRNFMKMSNEQLECCIELYTAHQVTPTVPDTSATVAEHAPEATPVAMPLAPPPPRIPVPAPPINPAPGASALAPEWPINGQISGWTPHGRVPAGLALGPPGLELPADAGHVVKAGMLLEPPVILAGNSQGLVADPHHMLPPQPLMAAPAPPMPSAEGVCVDDVSPATGDSAFMPRAPVGSPVPPMPAPPAAPPPPVVAHCPWEVTTAEPRRHAPAPPCPGPSSPLQVGVSLDAWLRKRLFQLRVTIALGPKELLSVLQQLDDEQLAPPFVEAKLWLGFDEQEPMPAALEQLMTEYRALRSSGTNIETSAATAPGHIGCGWGPKRS